jgi:hypothetical protein
MFCGGNNRFLSENIEYHVYTQLMTPYQNHVVVDRDGTAPIFANSTGPSGNGTTQTPVPSGGTYGVRVPLGYILDENDL